MGIFHYFPNGAGMVAVTMQNGIKGVDNEVEAMWP
jgi:hypothetical protein